MLKHLPFIYLLLALTLAVAGAGCTGPISNLFRLAQQEQTFKSQLEVNTKIDLLWVVDNSASMDVSQQKLRNGFAGFAQKYMQPTWDIRVAVITTDTYMAHPSFQNYLSTVIPGTVGRTSTHISGRLATWQNPSWNPNLFNKTTETFQFGIKYGELIPVWGPNYARLLPGLHDGPITALCAEIMPYFLAGITQCNIRDNQTLYSGPSDCISPQGGQTSVTQCVNTIQNDTVRSGKPILSTMPPAGTPGDATWTNQLIRDFMVNVTTGSAGQGSERGLTSLSQFVTDNESSDTRFFRKDSLRGIIFVADEDDQSMDIPSSPAAGFTPTSYYRCDRPSLLAKNTLAKVDTYCCASGCTYGSEGMGCPSKTVDGLTYTISVCPREDMLIPVSQFKTQMDDFFLALDQKSGVASASPNYFVTSIVPLTSAAITSMQTERNNNDGAVGAIKTVAVDRGDRYLEFGNLVGNGSLSMNIADDDYSPILDAIGRAIIEKKSTFILERTPTGAEDMIVAVKHADGTQSIVPENIYTISGKVLTITDQNYVLSLKATDAIVINYQPKSLNY